MGRGKDNDYTSFGVTGLDKNMPGKNFSPDDLIEMADQYLYQAKNTGRDKVVRGPFVNEIND